MQRVEPAALGRVPRRRDDRLCDDEAAEEVVAEPLRRMTDPYRRLFVRFVARPNSQELERLGQRGADGGGVSVLHRTEPK